MKESKKQIKAQVINEVQKQYSKRIKQVEETRDYWVARSLNAEEENKQLRSNISKLEKENAELKEKNAQYEDWVERMQEFCNMPDGERQQAFKTYMDSIELDETLNELSNTYSKMFSLFFN